jgi:hypothetical protein
VINFATNAGSAPPLLLLRVRLLRLLLRLRLRLRLLLRRLLLRLLRYSPQIRLKSDQLNDLRRVCTPHILNPEPFCEESVRFSSVRDVLRPCGCRPG